jgi:hypothetical protein
MEVAYAPETIVNPPFFGLADNEASVAASTNASRRKLLLSKGQTRADGSTPPNNTMYVLACLSKFLLMYIHK